MKLAHIPLEHLKPSPLNVRRHGGADVSDLIPLIRSQGVLQPLLVRPNCEGYEVIAGARRLKACQHLAQHGEGDVAELPCAIMEEGDDAAAIEASLAENIARLPMDEVDQYRAFAALIRQGRNAEGIAADFGVSERLVHQRLAIANLIAPVLTLYRKEQIGADTLRALTLATKAQQKAWVARYNDPADYAPQGRQLRQWLLGGEQIATTAALFPLEAYKGAVVTDLFGDEAYFADTAQFWTLQKLAIAERVEAYREAGWSDVVALEQGEHWYAYRYCKTSRSKGGKVFVAAAANGEVSFHEGYLTEIEFRRRERAKLQEQADTEADVSAAPRSELTKAARNYADLHRLAAARARLLGEKGITLRLIAAHIIAGSPHWRVQPEQGCAEKPEIGGSIEASTAHRAFVEERTAILALIGREPDDDHVTGGYAFDAGEVFEAIREMDDESVLRILGFVMAESLTMGTALIERLGTLMQIDMATIWSPDPSFLPLIRERKTLLAMLSEIATPDVVAAHTDSPAKLVRDVVRQYLTGEGRPQAEGWAPRYLRFPQSDYTQSA